MLLICLLSLATKQDCQNGFYLKNDHEYLKIQQQAEHPKWS